MGTIIERVRNVNIWQKIGIVLGAIIGLAALCLILWYCLWVHSIDKHELGFTYDRLTGQIEKIERNGWIVRTPLRYSVHHIDLRPYQINISANQRILNAKLVRFNPEGLQTFVSWHGRSAGDDLDSLKEILKCYAFDKLEGKDCPFLKVVGEISPNQAPEESQETQAK